MDWTYVGPCTYSMCKLYLGLGELSIDTSTQMAMNKFHEDDQQLLCIIWLFTLYNSGYLKDIAIQLHVCFLSLCFLIVAIEFSTNKVD